MDEATRTRLQRHGLGEFVEKLVNFGVHRLEDLKEVREADLDVMGMKEIQKRKFFRLVEDTASVDEYHALEDATMQRKRSTFSGLPSMFLKKNKSIQQHSSEYGENASVGSLERSSTGTSEMFRRSSSPPRPQDASKKMDGGGYGNGGHVDGREFRLDSSLTLEIKFNRNGQWYFGKQLEARSHANAVVHYCKSPQINWEEITSSSSYCATPQNKAMGSRYYACELPIQIPGSDELKVPAVKAVVRLRASVRQVMGLLLMESSNRLTERMKVLDGTFVNGQVFQVVSPRSSDGKSSVYQFPNVPLCTITRSCHNLPDCKQTRDFVFCDYLEMRNDNGSEVGVRAMFSVKENEFERTRSDKVYRGWIHEGSGFMVAPTGENTSEITMVLIAQVEDLGSSGGGFMKRLKKKRGTKPLESLISMADGLRVWIDWHVRRFGALANSDDFPGEAIPTGTSVVGGTPTATSAPKKAMNMLVAEGEQTEISPPPSPTRMQQQSTSDSGAGLPNPTPSTPIDEVEESNRANEVELPTTPKTGDEEDPPSPLDLKVVAGAATVADKSDVEKEQLKAQIERLKAEQLEREKQMKDEISKLMAHVESLQKEKMRSVKMSRTDLKHAMEKERLKYEREQMGGVQEEGEDEDDNDHKIRSVEEVQKDIDLTRENLLKKIEMMQQLIPQNINLDDFMKTLDEAEELMQEAGKKLMSAENAEQEMRFQQDFDRWFQVVQNHPDYKKREEEKWRKWEEKVAPGNEEALKEMRKLIKEDYLKMSVAEMTKDGVSMALAKRIQTKKIFQFYYFSEEKIARFHHADLTTQFVAQGLDLVELRALYACIPKEFPNDPTGLKTTWRANIKQKLSELISKEERNALSANEKRHAAYRPPKPKPAAGAVGGAPRFGAGARPPRAAPAGLLAALNKPRGPPGLMDALKNRGGGGEGAPRGPPDLMAALKKRAGGGEGAPRGPPDLMSAIKKRAGGGEGAPRGPPDLMSAIKKRAGGDEGAPRGPPNLMAEIQKRGVATEEKEKKAPAPSPSLAAGSSKRFTDSDLMKNLEKEFTTKSEAAKPKPAAVSQPEPAKTAPPKPPTTPPIPVTPQKPTSPTKPPTPATTLEKRRQSVTNDDIFKNLEQEFDRSASSGKSSTSSSTSATASKKSDKDTTDDKYSEMFADLNFK